jgi:hypothetical protein
MVLLAQGDDPRALFLAGVCHCCTDVGLVLKSVDLGYAPAQACMASDLWKDEERSFELAERSASQGYREGLFFLGVCFDEGCGCDSNKEKAISLFKQAADLGSVQAQFYFGQVAHGEHETERYKWWATAMKGGHGHGRNKFLDAVVSFVLKFNETGDFARIVFEMGLHLCDEIDGDTIAGVSFCKDETFQCALRAVELYTHWTTSARNAIIFWTWHAKNATALIKDVRVLIGKMLWTDRASWSF